MRSSTLLALLPVLGAQAVRIVQSNDDGWAELYLRSLNTALNEAGHDVVLSGPADNQSGTGISARAHLTLLKKREKENEQETHYFEGSRDEEPDPRTEPCQYDSCPKDSGPVGSNATDTRLNWVNSYPATSMRYGIEDFGPQAWGGEAPELAVSGPNVGNNLWLAVPFSGTVGAAVFAVNSGIPAIAFSGTSEGGNLPWDESPVPRRSRVYAELGAKLTDAVVDSGEPYLPEDTWLNVNFPDVNDDCPDADSFKFVLSRINPGTFSEDDVEHCGGDRLPTETEVVNTDGCYASVSVGDVDKTTAPADRQAVVLEKLGGLLTCLP